MMKHPRAVARPSLPTSPFGAPALIPPAEQFVVHDQVTHDKYGLGRVISVEDDTVQALMPPAARPVCALGRAGA